MFPEAPFTLFQGSWVVFAAHEPEDVSKIPVVFCVPVSPYKHVVNPVK